MASRGSLSTHEVALIKAFLLYTKENNQEILSYFSRPGRSINHRVISEIKNQSHFQDVKPASADELASFRASQLVPRPRVLSSRPPPKETSARFIPRENNSERLERDRYWIGANVDYHAIWSAYEAGLGYIDKFRSIPAHILLIEFDNSDFGDRTLYAGTLSIEEMRAYPLFDHEAIFKTLKGLFHDLKRQNLSSNEFNYSSPVFLYSVERGSAIYKFLGELKELLMLGLFLGNERRMAKRLNTAQERMDFVRRNFDQVNPNDLQRFVMAKTTPEMDEAMEKLMARGIRSVKISAAPIREAMDFETAKMIELKESHLGINARDLKAE